MQSLKQSIADQSTQIIKDAIYSAEVIQDLDDGFTDRLIDRSC